MVDISSFLFFIFGISTSIFAMGMVLAFVAILVYGFYTINGIASNNQENKYRSNLVYNIRKLLFYIFVLFVMMFAFIGAVKMMGS